MAEAKETAAPAHGPGSEYLVELSRIARKAQVCRMEEEMGVCLNSKMPFDNYAKMAASTYFVDKSLLLQELIPIVEDPLAVLQGDGLSRGGDIRYVCITRPRRFGKTVMAHMIASFFGKNTKSRVLFPKLAIGIGYSKKNKVHHCLVEELRD